MHISTNHRAERDAEYQALSKSLGMKSFPEHNISGNFYGQQGMKTENFDMPSLTSLSMSPVAMAQLQQMQKVPSASQMNMVRNQLREQQAINTNGGAGQQQQQQQQQQRSMMPAPGLPPNLTSCRLEARQELTGSAPNKTMEIQKIAQVQNTSGGGGGTVYMEDNDIEAVDPPALAIDSKVSLFPNSFLV